MKKLLTKFLFHGSNGVTYVFELKAFKWDSNCYRFRVWCTATPSSFGNHFTVSATLFGTFQECAISFVNNLKSIEYLSELSASFDKLIRKFEGGLSW